LDTAVKEGNSCILGEHSEEILRSLGRSDAEIEALTAAGVVGRDRAS